MKTESRLPLWAAAAMICLPVISFAGDNALPSIAARPALLTLHDDDLPDTPKPDVDGAPAPVPLHERSPPAASRQLIQGSLKPEGINRWGIAPPPGTLGQTYRRLSTLLPDDAHPRMAAVVVYLPEHADVSARGLKVTWTGEVWRLETPTPLVPGMPHIYAVQAEWDAPEGRVNETRWVRLIMGREVDLEFR